MFLHLRSRNSRDYANSIKSQLTMHPLLHGCCTDLAFSLLEAGIEVWEAQQGMREMIDEIKASDIPARLTAQQLVRFSSELTSLANWTVDTAHPERPGTES